VWISFLLTHTHGIHTHSSQSRPICMNVQPFLRWLIGRAAGLPPWLVGPSRSRPHDQAGNMSFFNPEPTPFTPSSVPTTNAAESGSFTCISCLVAFDSGDDQRNHYKTDWHRYNLKRKVAEMQPITQDEFAKRLVMQQEKTKSDALKSVWETKCEACKYVTSQIFMWVLTRWSKSYYNENSFNNHLQSKKHKDAAIALANMPKVEAAAVQTDQAGHADAMEVEANDATHINWKIKFAQATSEQEVQDLVKQKIETSRRLNVDKECLFCHHSSPDFDQNLDHMTRSHSLYIPDVEFLTDLRGLIEYLAEKVAVANVCLSCNGKGKTFHSMEAVRRHMIDMGHTKIAYDDDDDFEDLAAFYEFPEEDTPKAYWDTQTQELVLPSGARAGHRQFRHYYKQYLRPSQVVHKPTNLVHKLKNQYKQLGWYESTPPTAGQVASIVRAQKRNKMRQAKEQMQVGEKGNKFLQKYYRHHVIF